MNEVRKQLRSMLRVEPRETGFRAVLRVDPAFSLLPDHFAGNPILPGMCLVQAILLAGAQSQGVANLRLCSLKNAKFLGPAVPGDEVVIDAEVTAGDGGELRVKANLSIGGKRMAQIVLNARPELAGQEGAA